MIQLVLFSGISSNLIPTISIYNQEQSTQVSFGVLGIISRLNSSWFPVVVYRMAYIMSNRFKPLF